MEFASPASPCQLIHSELFPGIQLCIKRDDLLHATVSGNKFRKLKYPLQHIQQQGAAVLSMGLRLQMAVDAARGLLYLHRHVPPIVHRDVKVGLPAVAG